MKTYLIEKFKSLKAQIELLDQKAEIQKIEDEVKNILCKNPWHVFNDGDQNELYLFGENNTLSIVYAGKVTKAEWKYVKDLNSVEIATNDQIYMLQMAWLENSELLCMRLYGTNEYCFMIEDKKWETCGFKQLSDVTNHILAIEKQKEHLRIEAAKRAEEERQRLERQRFEEARRAEEERQRLERQRFEEARRAKKEQQRQEKLRQWNEEANQLQEVQLLNSKEKPLKNKTIAFFVIVAFVCALLHVLCSHYWWTSLKGEDTCFFSLLCIYIDFFNLSILGRLFVELDLTSKLDPVTSAPFDDLIDHFINDRRKLGGCISFFYFFFSFIGILGLLIYLFLLPAVLLKNMYLIIVPLLWGIQWLVCILFYLKFYRKNHERNQCEKSRIITEYVNGKRIEASRGTMIN